MGPGEEGRDGRRMAKEGFREIFYGTAFAVVVGWVLYIARDILIPIVFSVLAVYVIIGTSRLLGRIPGLGPVLPSKVRGTLSILIISAALCLLAWLILASLNQMVAKAPQYQSSLVTLVQRGARTFGFASEPSWESISQGVMAQVNLQRLAALMMLSLTSILASLMVIALYVVFLLIEQKPFAKKIANLSDDPQRTARIHRIITDVNARIGTYLALKTMLSVLLGVLSWAILVWMGVEFALFWALLVGLLNYVPYIGSVLGVLIPVLFALLQFGGLSQALVLAMALSVIQFLNGNLLDPYLMGSSLNLSPFVILVSLTVWSALWGIPGAFLAVPITACLAMILAEFSGGRPIAVLLSRDGKV
jgi:AI-2 transport protein TqsA